MAGKYIHEKDHLHITGCSCIPTNLTDIIENTGLELSRRDFVKGITAVGGLLAVSAIPSPAIAESKEVKKVRKEWQSYVDLIKKEVVPALGCTEPIAVALACAIAKKHLGSDPDTIEVLVSANVMKNGMGVAVPGTGKVGLPIAAAAGALGGDPERKLEVLETLTPATVERAKEMLGKNQVVIAVKNVPNVLYIEVNLTADDDKTTVIIADDHTNVVEISKNDKIVFAAEKSNTNVPVEDDLHKLARQITVEKVWDFALHAPLEMIEFINEAAVLNERISKEGLKGDYGLKIGKVINKNIDRGILQKGLLTEIMKRSSAASDARMGGCALPVMTNSGSGNQGIAATIPVLVTAERVGATDEQLTRALILSHLVAIHIHSYLPRLSALCGVTVASMGSASAIVFLMGGTRKQAEFAIINMIGDVAGIICDGAKPSCSLKVSTSVSAAVRAALMGLDNIRVTENEGIIDRDVEQVIKNLGILSREGMKETDHIILDIMTHKKHSTI
jgi:L-cysteine desulfidase